MTRPSHLLLLALPLALSAQISVALSPMPRAASQRLVGNAVLLWTAGIENLGSEAVSVSQSAILARAPQFLDHESAVMLIAYGSRTSLLARIGRSVEDGAKVGAYLAASEQMRWGTPAKVGLTAFLAFAPYAIQRFRGAAVPAAANFERLAWIQAMQLGPGESGIAHLFTAIPCKKCPEPAQITFVIETSKAAMRRSVQ